MSVIGLDFGSHACAIALWYEDKDLVEVLADDLGSRTIPSFVGFRADEVIVGQAAMSQYHKNHNNTFEDIRAMILNPDITTVNIPILDKEIPVQEIATHYFRNIHNQIKQQVGKAVRECVISIPGAILPEPIKQRLYESAQAGGIRIKSIISDSSSTLIANSFDDASITSAKVLVVDIGWSKSEAYVYSVSCGLFFPIANAVSTNISGKVLVNLLADHCAKDFQRKTKNSCIDSSKAMLRLRRECEESMKHLSTGQESTIDIDSLYEGMDYSSKISRAKFEDLGSILFIQLKNLIAEVLTNAKLTHDEITHVCLTGGLSAMPKVLVTIKSLFPNSIFPRGKFDSCETQCIGAALHGKALLQMGLLENAPTTSPTAVGLSRSILISPTASATDAVVILPEKSVLPALKKIPANLSQPKGYFQIFASAESGTTGAPVVLGEVVFEVEKIAATTVSADTPYLVSINVSVEIDSSIKVEVTNEKGDVVLATLAIPGPKV